MSDYSLVLSDELLSIYFDFKKGKIDNTHLAEKFFSYYHAPYLTNTKQLNNIGVTVDQSVLQQLVSQGYINQTLDELVKETRYKIILNTEKSNYPYVNINNDVIEKNFSLTFKRGENRDKAIQLITALCVDAKFILIFDHYFCKNWKNTKQLFDDVLPKKPLTLLHDKHLVDKSGEIKKICGQWKIKEDRHHTFTHSHDRYLLIDDKIEIILSSGFDHLFSTDKDLSCLIRYTG
jgi:hypothetical protein